MSFEEDNFMKFVDEAEQPDGKKEAEEKFRSLRRKPKDQVYIECKLDLAHLFYLNQRIQTSVPHGIHPNMTLEDFPVKDDVELSRYNFPYYTMAEARPIYIAKKHCERLDPCFRRVIGRTFHRNRLTMIRALYQKRIKGK